MLLCDRGFPYETKYFFTRSLEGMFGNKDLARMQMWQVELLNYIQQANSIYNYTHSLRPSKRIVISFEAVKCLMCSSHLPLKQNKPSYK